MPDEFIGPYDKDTCHFCGKSAKDTCDTCKKAKQDCVHFVAGFARAEDGKPRGPFFDACQVCAAKPVPQPKQFQKEETKDATVRPE